MLLGLSVRDIVLIDRLELRLQPGLTVLTGETGAGKSILLDALGLALGFRSDFQLLRAGTEKGVVTAEFELSPDHAALALLQERELAAGRTLILRRQLAGDGRTRAFVNDEPIGVGLLRRLGDSLVEVHGQRDDRGLMNAASHRELLDAFGGLAPAVARCRNAFAALHRAEEAVAQAEREFAQAQTDEDYLRHAVAELESLKPQASEETALAETRQLLQQGEKLVEALREALQVLEDGDGVDQRIRRAERELRRIAGVAAGRLDAALAALDRAAVESTEAMSQVAEVAGRLEPDPARLEQVEERLFALRELARKHRCEVDDLAALEDNLKTRLAELEGGEDRLTALRLEAVALRRSFEEAAVKLTSLRRQAARRLDAAMVDQLAPLKLDKARFETALEPLEQASWTAEGAERIALQVATNSGARPGPLNRIASGGELSRFMLALRVALAGTRSAETLVFDEVDRGVGGAVADKVGERLADLARGAQVLVVTHSPQVAARADHHWRVVKDETTGLARTRVSALGEAEQREEIARMLAGAEITSEALAAAASLIDMGRR